MKKIFWKFVFWFLAFGLSFLGSEVFGFDQGRTFFWLKMGTAIIVAVGPLMLFLLACLFTGKVGTSLAVTFATVFVGIVVIGASLLATWAATLLFDIDFFVAYQIMTFGQCLCYAAQKND